MYQSFVIGFVTAYLIFATISFGFILAPIISWHRNTSVRWALFHGLLGWFYVLYYCLRLRKRKQLSSEVS